MLADSVSPPEPLRTMLSARDPQSQTGWIPHLGDLGLPPPAAPLVNEIMTAVESRFSSPPLGISSDQTFNGVHRNRFLGMRTMQRDKEAKISLPLDFPVHPLLSTLLSTVALCSSF